MRVQPATQMYGLPCAVVSLGFTLIPNNLPFSGRIYKETIMGNLRNVGFLGQGVGLPHAGFWLVSATPEHLSPQR